jgi:hypothetical protein
VERIKDPAAWTVTLGSSEVWEKIWSACSLEKFLEEVKIR